MSANPSNATNWMLRPGDKVEKFEIVGQIGSGGQSIVFKGYDRLLDRYVAIKQLNFDPRHTSNEEAFRENFRKEAALQKRLSGQHKHLVRILDFVEDQRGLFIIMEYVEGQSLEQMLAQNPAPVETPLALGIVGAAAMGLAAIHREGLVHRDLKPANILLDKRGGLKVCDFGLATLLGQQDAMDVGTVRYLAPECFDDEQPATATADIYALGMIAYEMLAGREKFEQAFKIVLRDQRNQALRWMKWHTNMRVTAPLLHTLNPAVPPKLSELVARMMEKVPEKRIASAEELVAAIRRHFAGKEEPQAHTVETQATPTAQPTAPLPRKKPLPRLILALVGASGVLVLAALVGLIMLGVRNSREQQARQAARQAAVQQYLDLRQRFNSGDFDGTKDGFERLQAAWKSDASLSKAIEAHLLFIQAHDALNAKDYDKALPLLQKVDNMADNQGRPIVDRDLVQNTERDATIRQTLANIIAKVEADISASKFDEARQELSDLRSRDTLKLTDSEKARLDDLGAQIEGRARHAQYQEVLDRDASLWSAGQRNQAMTLLSDAYGQAHVQAFLTQRQTYQNQMDLERATAAMNAAAQGGNWGEAIIQAKKVLTLNKADPQTEARLHQFQANADYQRATELEQAGDIPGAKRLYLAAEPYKPEAKDALKRLETAATRDDLLREAETQAAAGNWASAIMQYEKVLKMAPDPAVAGKLKDAKVQLQLQVAQALVDAKKVPEARAALAKVFDLDPTNPTARQLSQTADKIDQYDKFLTQGDAYRNQGRYTEAKVAYDKARALMDTEEVRQRQSDTEYDSLIANAHRDIQAKNWINARGWLETIRRNYPDRAKAQEVQAMLAEVAKHASETKPPEN